MAKRKCHRYEAEDLVDKLDSINFKLSKIMAVAPQHKIPLGLMYDALRCNICQSSPLRPLHVVASRLLAAPSASTNGTKEKMEC